MKLTGQRLQRFLARPDDAVVVALLYGPDQGLVRERARQLVTVLAGDPSDPFRIAELGAEALKEDRTRLADEAAALPFSGGRRVVRVREARETAVDAVRLLLEGEAPGFAVLEAGELGPRSPLRLLFEGSERAAAIACYPDEGEALRSLLAADLAAHGLAVADEALRVLESHLGADRGLIRQELEKLALYKGGAGRIDADDVLAVVADAGALSLDTVAYAACDGDLVALDRALAQAEKGDAAPIPLLRAMARHLLRLLQAQAAVAGGAAPKQAMEQLRPPVFFRLQPAFRRQLDAWTPARLSAALTLVADAELACKRTGAPQPLLARQALSAIAALRRRSAPA